MRVLLVGAGSVGCVLCRAIEQTKGNDVTLLLRAGRKKGFERFKILDARTGAMNVRERPTSVEIGQVRPSIDTVLFCVRADQMEAAIADVGPLSPDTRVATITPGPDGLALLRNAYPGRPAVRSTPSFAAYLDGDTTVLWIPPLVKTTVSYEGDDTSAAFAKELASAYEAGGIPARSRPHVGQAVDIGNDAFMPLLAAYAVADYDADALTADRVLLSLTSDAIGEALTIAGAPGIAGAIARKAAGPLIRTGIGMLAPRLPDPLRNLWKVHAPKIESQTRGVMEALVRRGQETMREATAITELLRRMDARTEAATAATAATAAAATKETA